MKTEENDEILTELNYTVNSTNEVEFSLSDLINEGIDLEKLDTVTYYLFVKVTYEDEEAQYYSLVNDTEYENVEYYTLTKDNKNNKININFNTYEISTDKIDYMYISVNQTILPDDVYDVVIDPGHGGADVGATYGSYYEADLVLECAQELKEELESLGLKVKITRDGTEDNSFNVYSVYDEDGRVNVVRKF